MSKKLSNKLLVRKTNERDAKRWQAKPAASEYYTQWHEATVIRDGLNHPLVIIPDWARGHQVQITVGFYDKDKCGGGYAYEQNARIWGWESKDQRAYDLSYYTSHKEIATAYIKLGFYFDFLIKK